MRNSRTKYSTTHLHWTSKTAQVRPRTSWSTGRCNQIFAKQSLTANRTHTRKHSRATACRCVLLRGGLTWLQQNNKTLGRGRAGATKFIRYYTAVHAPRVFSREEIRQLWQPDRWGIPVGFGWPTLSDFFVLHVQRMLHSWCLFFFHWNLNTLIDSSWIQIILF